MALIKLSQAQRLYIVIGISACFFITEIVIGFYTHSLALIADAFHYLSDLTGFIVALTAILITKRGKSPQGFSFGWQRARLLGAFFNGVFLAALGLSIFLQSLERLVSIQKVEQPKLVLIVGAIGLTLNIISGAFLHEHDHGDHAHVSSGDDIPLEETSGTFSPTTASFNVAGAGVHNHHRHRTAPTKPGHHRDLGMLGAFIHVCGDAANNIGVIIAATIIWQTKSEKRYYADPAISMLISVMIAITSFPLIKNSGRILLESAPSGMNIMEVQKDLEEVSRSNRSSQGHE
jgi:zinc transporter 1